MRHASKHRPRHFEDRGQTVPALRLVCDTTGSGTAQAGAGEVMSVEQFSDRHRDNDKPHKLAALQYGRRREPLSPLLVSILLRETRFGLTPIGFRAMYCLLL